MLERPYVQNVLFCDDVRSERNGKEIAIGIYPGYMALPNLPFIIPYMAIRFELMFYGESINEFGVKIVDPAGNSLTEQQRPLEFADWKQPGTVVIFLEGLIAATRGNYSVYTRVSGRDWELQRSLAIEKFDPVRAKARWDEMMRQGAETAPSNA